VVVASHSGQVQYATTGQIYYPQPWDEKRITIVGDLIVDRALFDPGEIIHATAFLRCYDWKGEDIAIPTWHPSWSHLAGQAVFESPWGKIMTTVDDFGQYTRNQLLLLVISGPLWTD